MLKCSYGKCRTKVVTKIVKGLCLSCYYRLKKRGTLEFKDRASPPCSIEECNETSVANGVCDTHRKRIERHGDANAGRPKGWGDVRARRDRQNTAKRNLSFREKKSRHLRKAFKITMEDYEDMLKEQGGTCAICGKPDEVIHPHTKEPRALAVDHNDTTKKVRGLLCGHHNTALGLFNHDINLLEAAIAYLRRHQ